ncbi:MULTISPECIES: hypothetical protein [unclassified Streptomyces]|uniref:hypothetical protein n=1 Tax=unclassified Streptomyces TaxID=2593676 RepID=UPI0037FBCB9D|nr:hypothetical protein OG199_13590 [Streptomyces sp. NBC_01176]
MAVSDAHTGVLVLRVWYEPGRTPALRARLLVVDSPDQVPAEYSAAAGLDTICDQVRAWLENGNRSMEASEE